MNTSEDKRGTGRVMFIVLALVALALAALPALRPVHGADAFPQTTDCSESAPGNASQAC